MSEIEELKQEYETQARRSFGAHNIGIAAAEDDDALRFVNKLIAAFPALLARVEQLEGCLQDIEDIAYHWDGYYDPETGTGSLKDLADLVKELYDLAQTRKPIPPMEEK